MTVFRALTAFAGVLTLLLIAGCGDDPSRPDPVYQVPQVKGVIEPPGTTSLHYASQIHVTASGSIVVRLLDRIAVLDAEGNPLREIPVEPDEDHHFPDYFRVAATRNSVVVLLNQSRRIRVLTADGTPVREFAFEAPEAIDFRFFFDVAATENGKIFVLDSALRRIQRFTPEGVVDRVWGSRGVGPGQMEEPRALVADRAGNLYVLDIDLWRVTKFSPDGDLVTSWDMVRTVQFGALFEGTMAVDDDGRPVIVDYTYAPGRVTTLNPGGGNEASAWPLPDDSPLIRGVAIRGPEILMTDFYGERILRFSDSGSFIGSIGHAYGSGPGETELIGAIVSPSPGRVTIFDPLRNRMENYDTAGRFLGSIALTEGFNTSRAISDGQGNFWCRNARSNGVVHLSAGGEILSEWAVAVDSDASFQDLALDADGRLFLLIMSGPEFHVEVRTQTGSLVRRITLPRDTAKRLPADIALDGSGRAWILDPPARLLRVSLISGHAETVRWPASIAGIEAVAIAFDTDGFLLVADRSTPRILVFDDRMNLQGEFGRDAFEGIDREHFGRPFAVTPDGHVLVTASERRAWIFGS